MVGTLETDSTSRQTVSFVLPRLSARPVDSNLSDLDAITSLCVWGSKEGQYRQFQAGLFSTSNAEQIGSSYLAASRRPVDAADLQFLLGQPWFRRAGAQLESLGEVRGPRLVSRRPGTRAGRRREGGGIRGKSKLSRCRIGVKNREEQRRVADDGVAEKEPATRTPRRFDAAVGQRTSRERPARLLESDLAGTGDDGGGMRAGRVPAKDLAGRGVLGRGLRDRGGPKGRIACSRFEVDCGPD